jgi:type III pantothenate kinase
MGRTLLVDLGNTRLKWAWLAATGRVGRMQAAAHADWQTKDFRQVVKALRPVDRVMAVSVAAPKVQRAFVAAIRERIGCAPQWLRSERSAAGVRNGYREPWRLGADRWAALLGARSAQRDVLVVDVGTAVTIDLLDASGRHHGGAILPGEALMVSSLLSGTGGIRRRAARDRPYSRSLFAHSTREAIEAGAQHALRASVEAAVVAATHRLGRSPQLWLTGGGVTALRRVVSIDHEWRPALVLEGLAVFLHHESVRGERKT